MNRIEKLVSSYENYISLPWSKNLAGAQKVIFLVYPKTEERRLRAYITSFENVTIDQGYQWSSFDLTDSVAEWIVNLKYKQEYFESPEDMIPIYPEYEKWITNRINSFWGTQENPETTVLALHGLGGIFGFSRISRIVEMLTDAIKGRLLVFFPGEWENNNYRFLDARDGWNYHAVPITVDKG
ncbi:BREX protein BrxB domain-containing protein [Leptospira levettii]|uniref:BREX protein BrxB domain-containing protein n=1 Tax=Leptospira levettii TaxID=2023178 RepID=UPI003EC0EE74